MKKLIISLFCLFCFLLNCTFVQTFAPATTIHSTDFDDAWDVAKSGGLLYVAIFYR